MRTANRSWVLCAAIAASFPATNASAGLVNNVLTQWRAQSDKCEEPRQRDADTMVSVAVFEAINAITPKYTPYTKTLDAPEGSSPEAAAARAAHDVLVVVCADQKGMFDDALKTSLDAIADTTARANGEKVGSAAADAVMAARANSNAEGKDPVNRPQTPGTYVQTTVLVGTIMAKQTPWIMRSPDEMRPAPPAGLGSAIWARDFNEVRTLGAKKSKDRTAEQTDIGSFWAQRDVRIVLNQFIGRPGRSLVDDARFLALAEMAWADSYVSMMDGKYHYMFWRPVTAIRNAETDGNDATTPDTQWEAMVQTPNHPEYPCGHCLSAGAVGAVIYQEFGSAAPPIVLEMEGAMLRRYDTPQEYIDDVSESRILAGVHYRFSMEAGRKAGIEIGNTAAKRYFTPLKR
ncbi:vanadium-dependent haloperoxidase [Sphingorhabdus sp.]|uniref:vanadium-dependent haloperoxidase n=1 Tax=Sphingorhabdus sp. TaxID=1902408 RepID=UPI0035934DFC